MTAAPKLRRHAWLALVPLLWPLAANAQDVPIPVTEGQVHALCYGDHTSGASIDFTGDVDIFFFFGQAGDKVRVTVRGGAIGLDPRIEVRDPTNNVVTTASCSAADGTFGSVCGFEETFDLSVGGAHTILVDEVGNTQTGAYTLDIQRVLPDTAEPYLAPGVATDVAIGHAGDHDYLRFVAEAGSEVFFVVSGLNIGLDPHVEIFEEDGTLLHEASCLAADGTFGNTCTFNFSGGGPNAAFEFPGQVGSIGVPGEVRRYIARISDVGFDQTGTIRVTMNCIFSPSFMCPPPQPAFGPVGASYCTANTNSTGVAAALTAVGSASLADDDFHLLVSGAPGGKAGLFLFGPNQGFVPLFSGSSGNLCLSLPIGRFPLTGTCELGSAHQRLDLPSLPQNILMQPGSTWNFQMWFRDNDPGPTSNTTDGLSMTFQ